MRKFLGFLICFSGVAVSAVAAPVFFPAGFVPFTSIYSISRPDANGDRIVEGASTLATFFVLQSLPTSASNQQFSDASIQLAPGQFFSNVYLPSAAELQGDFSDIPIPVIDPFAGVPFVANIIPKSRLADLFVFRIGPATASPTPEPAGLAMLALAVPLLRALVRKRRA